MSPIIEARDLHVYYGASHILRGVTVALAPGETLGLMGRNGMGKTTLLRTIMGLVRPRSGQIAFAGRDVTLAPTFRIAAAGIAYVPEGRGIFSSLTVAENLQIATKPGGDGRSEWSLDRVLSLFPRLGERLSNRGHQLSGGEQQMLAIGRALLTNPQVLILDEATEGLAPLVREQIWQTVRIVREAGLAAIIVDKNIADVAAVADRILVLVKGEAVFEGHPEALTADTALMQRHLGV